MCNAVAYAHSRGVLHRDLKPGNIMLGKYGETLVVDWGLAKLTGNPQREQGSAEETVIRPRSGVDSTATLAGDAKGTPAYMPPEQAAGEWDKLGPQSDVYGLGATLYELLTSRRPFEGKLDEVLAKVKRGDFPTPRSVNPNVPRALEAVCLKAIALEPDDRFASVLELALDLNHWLADEKVSSWREPNALRVARWCRKHPGRAILALLVLLTMASEVFALAIGASFGSLTVAEKLMESIFLAPYFYAVSAVSIGIALSIPIIAVQIVRAFLIRRQRRDWWIRIAATIETCVLVGAIAVPILLVVLAGYVFAADKSFTPIWIFQLTDKEQSMTLSFIRVIDWRDWLPIVATGGLVFGASVGALLAVVQQKSTRTLLAYSSTIGVSCAVIAVMNWALELTAVVEFVDNL